MPSRTQSLRRRWRAGRAAVSPPYHELLEEAVGDAESVLDVGCGDRSPVHRFSRRAARLVGVDAHPASIERSRAAGIHDEYVLADVRTIGDRFAAGSFEAVVAIDLIEHLEAEDGLRLLEAAEAIARRRVVIFTPNGFVRQSAREDNPWQVHLSGWSARRLRSLGYDVRGVHGLRALRGEEARIRWRPRRLWHLVSDLTQPLASRVPSLAYQLLAVKDVEAGGRIGRRP